VNSAWPDEIDLPDNWDTMCNAQGCAAADAADGSWMCVSMFIGKRLGTEWQRMTACSAVIRLIGLGFPEAEALYLVRENDGGEGGTKTAIRKALEMKGYEVPR